MTSWNASCKSEFATSFRSLDQRGFAVVKSEKHKKNNFGIKKKNFKPTHGKKKIHKKKC